MGIQVQIAASQIDKGRLGYAAVSLTHFSDTVEPSIASGSKIEIGGALYEFTADETGTGWGGIGTDNTVFLLLTPSGSSVSWSYTTTPPAWSASKQAWYSGSNRVFGLLYKDASGNYEMKSLLGPLTGGIGKCRMFPLDSTKARNISTPLPAAGSWSAAIAGIGVQGIPSIAVALKCKIAVQAYAAAAGVFTLLASLSNNNANTPTTSTAHPMLEQYGYAGAAAYFISYHEITLVLDSSGNFYLRNHTETNVDHGNCGISLAVMGYYLGD